MDEKQEIIRFRVAKSDEAIVEAELMLRAKHFNTAVSRLYYSSFYIVSALLYKDDYFTKTHSGLKTLFHQHYIKTGKMTNEDAEIYKELFENRQDSDYADFIVFSEEEVEGLLERTKALNREIKKLI